MDKEPFVYIILVSINQKEDTLECLNSLKSLNYKNYRIILVDNGSTDGLDREVLIRYPEVNLIRLDANTGAAAGRNAGLRQVSQEEFDYVFFLDNDALVEPSTLRELVKIAEQDDSIAGVGARVFYYHQPTTIWCDGGARWNWIKGNFSDSFQGKSVDRLSELSRPVDSFPIGFGIVRKEAIDKTGYIDERYFIYHEEADWFARMRKQGFRFVTAPCARIWHKASSSLGKGSSFFYYYRTRNLFLFIYANSSKWLFPFFMVWGLLNWSYHTLLTLYLSQKTKEYRAAIIGLIDFFKRQWGKKELDVEALSEPLYKRFFMKFIRYFKHLPLEGISEIGFILLFLYKFIRRFRFYHSVREIKQILIIYMAEGLGDCILFSGILPAIRTRFKNSKTNLLIFERFGEYFLGNPYIDQLFLYPDYRYVQKGLRGFIGYSREIKKHCSLDVGIDLLPNRFIKPAIFTWFIPKRLSIGFDYSIKKLFYDIPVKIDWGKFFYYAIFDALKPLGIEKKEPQYWVPQDLSNQDFSIDGDFSGKTIILAPGGKFNLLKPQGYGGFKYYPELVSRLVENGYRVILVGAGYDIDLQFLKDNFLQNKVINLCGRTSIPQLFTLVKNYADLVICNTSGLLYVALALGVPAVFYVHPLENLKRWHPAPEKREYVALRDTESNPVTINSFLYAINKILAEKRDEERKIKSKSS
jgi:GT2 family glycosyltransferase/ADP-heptose:LPS heptosyltransferase